MARSTPAPPAGLAAAGKRLWRELHKALPEQAEFDERERSILGLAARQADDIAALERAMKRDGVRVSGSKGQPRLHPAVAELRQARLALTRLLGELEIPDFAEAAPKTSRSKRAQKAANVRWANDARRAERRRALDG